jgi:antitoxin Phd
VYINTETIFSMTQANQNFSVVARAADRNGEAVVFKNNRPKYLVVNLESSGRLFDLTEDEKAEIVAKRALNKEREKI